MGLVGRLNGDYSAPVRALVCSFELGSRLFRAFGFGHRLVLGCAWLMGSALVAGCTLITDVNREDIPQPAVPVFPEGDAGPDAAPDPVMTPEDAGTADIDAGTADTGAASTADTGAEG